MGILYDKSLVALVIFSLAAQLASLPFFVKTNRLLKSKAAPVEAT